MGYSPFLKWTTRPMRKFEKQGVEYNFVTEDKFINAMDDKSFLVYQKFDVTSVDNIHSTWYYGITMEEFKYKELFIMTPGEVNDIDESLLNDSFIIYLDIDRDVREDRIRKREDGNDSIKRRLDSDDKDFSNFSKYNIRITDHNFKVEEIVKNIK